MRQQLLRILVFLSVLHSHHANTQMIDPDANIADTTTTILGVNHIGLSVTDLEKTLAFYRQATGFKLLKRERIQSSERADRLFSRQGTDVEIAVLQAPNMLLEIAEFAHNRDVIWADMPPWGPGMTHTCYQSPESDSGYIKFVDAGARLLTRGDKPVDLGGYGVTYAYAYDPDGNMFELEQLAGNRLQDSVFGASNAKQTPTMWMSQVSFATHDIERLMGFYENLLGFSPYRDGEYKNLKPMEDVVDIDNLHLKVGWFRISKRTKIMEFWQYISPATPAYRGQREPASLGYSYSLEVSDIDLEYQRLKALGVKIFSEPVTLGEFRQFYAADIDGNIFAIREARNPQSMFSVNRFDPLN